MHARSFFPLAGLLALASFAVQTTDSPAELSLEDRLRGSVEYLAGMDPPRNHLHPEALQAAADWITESWERTGLEVERYEYDADGESYVNLGLRMGPSSGPLLIVGAHYDCAEGTPGADDNASGVAVLCELVDALAGAELERPLLFMAYTLEEPPYYATEHMGSFHHAARLREEGAEVAGMISLEMLGFYSDEDGSQSYPVEALAERFGTVGDFLSVVGRPADRALVEGLHGAMTTDEGLRIETLLAPRWLRGMDFSDHRSFWGHDYTGAMVTDTAFLRNELYHTEGDLPDTLDYERMGRATRALAGALLHLCSEDSPLILTANER